MKRTSTTHRLRHRRNPIGVVALGFVLITLAVFSGIRYLPSGSYLRQTIAVVSDGMMHIVSWDAPKARVVLLAVPTSTVIEGTHGYGAYAIHSLHTLDAIDGKRGKVFLDSISDAFGIPITGFVSLNETSPSSGSVEFLRSVFSWKSLLSPQHFRSIGLGNWISYVWATMGLKTDAVEMKSIQGALASQSRPDGSSVDILDPQRFDYLFNRVFVDSGIRQEGISVAIYNTTNTPTIGTRAARILSAYGVSIVSVGNDTSTTPATCRISGSKTNMQSRTARFIQEYFQCEKILAESETERGAELVVRLGTSYADQFAPKK